MCGILFSSGTNQSRNAFQDALDSMSHRGPDYQGTWFNDAGVAMGHNRLSIQDTLARSNQPFVSGDGNHVLIFNGEIYNFKELRKDFQLNCRTESDTEVLLELYIKLGPAMLEHLNGMFAFVIYNTQTTDVFAARDRLGIKPLYHYQAKNRLIFASEIAAVLTLAPQQEFDSLGIRQYLKLRTFFNGHTIHKNISMFPAGHYYLNGKVVEYWRLPEQPTREHWHLDEIESLIGSAVDYRCIADVPLGSYLSGGLDSTIITLLTKNRFTWTVGSATNNEFEWARMAANHLGTEHDELVVSKEEYLEAAEHLIDIRREPLSVPNEVMIYKMTQRVKRENTVVLSGEGADEAFSGYDRIYRWANSSAWDVAQFDAHYSYGSHSDLEIVAYASEPYRSRESCLDIVSAFMQTSHLHGLLRRLDNSTMMCAVEARVPFVDHRLVEYMSGAPLSFRMKDGIIKAPLKQIYGTRLPRQLVEREKVGFPVDLEDVLPGSNENMMDRWLDYNMSRVVGENWSELKSNIFADAHIEAGVS
ncbi:asparagine synthase (glutamine-hydrolyzing) [Halieaceae bacterium IMCC14734]|uniref:asparagine synthase (glutamine-hydrolyzing) n=1 Tax=Candidatus Litorirhabdus singularis TaxID=2518993 RepID=A0ABT3TBD7_9GAMM|nr:asparagine synthase (glutamine-hydrolyzing) [Candidatus Litorirhabdus singularis]MCX2979603.1 asparagine synthase (glutamine-hydrolyzing) [Candidatus Litorirhabdus singularis]